MAPISKGKRMETTKRKDDSASLKTDFKAKKAKMPSIDEDEDFDSYFDSDRRIEAIFQRSNRGFGLDQDDERRAAEEAQVFLKTGNSRYSSKKSYSKSRNDESNETSESEETKTANVASTSLSDSIDELLMDDDSDEEDYFLKTKSDDKSNKKTVERTIGIVIDSDSDDEGFQPRTNGNNGASKKTSDNLEITISDDELSEPEADLGSMLIFSVEYNSNKIPVRLYELQLVEDLKQLVAEKAKVSAEGLELWRNGPRQKLVDTKTLKQCQIQNLCVVHACYSTKTEQQLYDEGSRFILRFKLQTDDRRGRQDQFVYIKKTGPMQAAVDQYAKIRGIESNGLKLMFDGDPIDLSLPPSDCDLEGDECLDLLLPRITSSGPPSR